MNLTGIETTLKNLLEKAPWGVEVLSGTRLTMEFGEEVLRPKHKQVHGEWHLLLQDCHWRVESAHSVIVGSDDDNLSVSIEDVTFGKVSGIRVVPPSNDLELEFDNGLRLTTFLTHSRISSESKQWYLFLPDQDVLVAEGAGVVTRKNRNAAPARDENLVG